MTIKRTNEVKKEGTATYGVLALVCPPVGPAVPLSLTVYVDFNVPRTWSASPATIAGVGPV